MVAPYNPPVKNDDFVLYVSVHDMNSAGSFKVNPTIAAGDWKISKDGGAFTNLTNLPTVTPAGGVAIKLELTSSEMNADNVFIQGVDQTTPKEWADFALSIPTTT